MGNPLGWLICKLWHLGTYSEMVLIEYPERNLQVEYAYIHVCATCGRPLRRRRAGG